MLPKGKAKAEGAKSPRPRSSTSSGPRPRSSTSSGGRPRTPPRFRTPPPSSPTTKAPGRPSTVNTGRARTPPRATGKFSPLDRRPQQVKAKARPKKVVEAACAVSPEIKEYRARVDFLHTIMTPNIDLHRYLDAVVLEIIRVTEADRCSIFFADDFRREILCIRSLDIDPIRLPWGRGIVGQVAMEGKVMETSDAHSHPSFDSTMDKKTGYVTKSLICYPIKHTMDDSRTIGVIQALNKKGGAPFSSDDSTEILKVVMLIGDSFNRHRWHALEEGASHGDSGASSLIAHQHGDFQTSKGEAQLKEASGLADMRSSPSLPAFQSLHRDADGAIPVSLLRSLMFNAFEHSGDKLVAHVPIMMEHTGCIEGCGVPSRALHLWAVAVQKKYRDNPFHNWFHGFSVFQMCYFQMFTSVDTFHEIRYLDVLSLLVAALCHDVDHPGYTNSYLIQTEDVLALRYNDVSVLENHHASLTCELLRGESTRITAGLDEASRRVVRKTVIRCILDTDMVHHNELCKKVEDLIGTVEECAPQTSVDEKRQFLLSTCIHTSDLSGQVLPWPVAKQWEDRVAQEFVAQAAAEIAAGYTPMPFMQFAIEDTKKRGKLQRDFVDFVLLPLWMPYTDKLPDLHPCYENLVANRARYNHRVEHGRDAEEIELPAGNTQEGSVVNATFSREGKHLSK